MIPPLFSISHTVSTITISVNSTSTISPGCTQMTLTESLAVDTVPDSKAHGANLGPVWVRQDPGRPHVGPMNLATCKAIITRFRSWNNMGCAVCFALCSYSYHLINTWWRHQMETFFALLALCVGNSPVPVNSPHKGQWRGALLFSSISACINAWVNNREAGDLRRHGGHYDAIAMNYCPQVTRWWFEGVIG